MTIARRGNQWCALSEDGTRSFGCFDTREQAVARLGQVEDFKDRALSFPSVSSEAIECGDHYEKDLIYVGKFIHPSTGQKFSIDKPRIDQWISAFEKMKANGVSVPFADGHRHKARDVYGKMIGMRRDGDRAVGIFSIEDEDAKKKMGKGITEVSVQIVPNFADGKGVQYGEVIRHVAATPYPIIPNQGNFIKLSDDEEIEIYQLSFTMEDGDMKELLKKLDVKDEKEALEKVASFGTEIEELKAKVTELSEKKPAKKPEEKKVVENKEESAQVKELSEKLAKLEGTRRGEYLDLAVENGKITPEQRKSYLSLMETGGGDGTVREIIDALDSSGSEGEEITRAKTAEDEVDAEIAASLKLAEDD